MGNMSIATAIGLLALVVICLWLLLRLTRGLRGRDDIDGLVEDMKAEGKQATNSLIPKWRLYIDTLKFREDVPLHEIMDGFLAPAFTYITRNYRLLPNAPPGVLYMIVFTAILESKTHPADDINRAIEVLHEKYGR